MKGSPTYTQGSEDERVRAVHTLCSVNGLRDPERIHLPTDGTDRGEGFRAVGRGAIEHREARPLAGRKGAEVEIEERSLIARTAKVIVGGIEKRGWRIDFIIGRRVRYRASGIPRVRRPETVVCRRF